MVWRKRFKFIEDTPITLNSYNRRFNVMALSRENASAESGGWEREALVKRTTDEAKSINNIRKLPNPSFDWLHDGAPEKNTGKTYTSF